jgi:predicted PurR-regulated permease PerM
VAVEAPEDDRDPPRRALAPPRRRTIFLWVSALAATAVLIAASDVLLPFILALVVAYILLPIVLFVERRRVPRWISILLVYAAALGLVGGFIALTVPSMVREVRSLERDLPRRIEFIQKNWLPVVDKKLADWSGSPASAPSQDKAPPPPPPETSTRSDKSDDDTDAPRPTMLVEKRPDGSYEVVLGDHVQLRKVNDDVWRLEPEERREQLSTAKLLSKALSRGARYMSENTGEVIRLGQAIVGAVWRGVFTLFMTLMLAGYMMLTHEAIIGFFRDLESSDSRPAFDRLLHRLDRGLNGVVRGQLIICVVNGILAAIGFWLFGLKYWPIMAVVAAVGSIVPIFGSILSAIPAVAIGLTQSPGTALAVLAWIIGIHQIEANLLNPKIIGDQAKIHPVLVVFSLIVGEHFFQIKGALFAVPAMSVVQTIFLHFRETVLGLPDPLATGSGATKRPPEKAPPPA